MGELTPTSRQIVVATQRSLVDKVMDAIVAEIESGHLSPSTRLIQDDLARAYGVSRQPVQQALLLLKNKGLVRQSTSRGFVVCPLDPDHVQNLYDIRAELDGLAARKAAQRNAARARQEGPPIIARGRGAIADRSLPGQIAADMEFHSLISELSENPLIAEAVAPNWAYVRRVMAEVLRADEMLPNSIWDEHEAILRAVSAGDAQTAESLSRRHILDASAVLVGRLRDRRNATDAEERRSSRKIER